MMIKRLFYSSLLLTALNHFQLSAVIIGSETVVSVQAAATFPSADTDNTMLGFAWFKNGFTLQDNLTSVTYDSVYPISGGVDMRGGTLYLSDDLYFNDVTNLQGLGTIVGNDHIVDLCPSITALPSTINVIENLVLSFRDDLALSSSLICNGECTINGFGNNLTLDPNAFIVVQPSSRLTLRNMIVEGIAGNQIACADDSATLVLDGVVWIQSAATAFNQGSILFDNMVDFNGTGTFFYTSSQTSTINQRATWNIGNGMALSIGRQAVGANEPLNFTDNTSRLVFDNSTFSVSPGGIHLLNGVIQLSRNVIVDVNSTSTVNGFHFGDGNPAHDLTLELIPGAQLKVTKGHWILDDGTTSNIKSTSTISRLIRTSPSTFYLKNDLQVPAMTLETSAVAASVFDVGKVLTFKNSSVVLGSNEFDITGTRYDPVTME